MNNKNNIWLYTFNKSASTAVRKPLGGNVNRPTTPVQVKAKSAEEYATENQKLKDNKSMSTPEYMKKYYPQTYTQTTTNNPDGSVTNSRKDNNGNFVNVTTSKQKTKPHWTEAYKNNPGKINNAIEEFNKTDQLKRSLDNQIATMEREMSELGSTPGDLHRKKELNYNLYALKQKQRATLNRYNRMFAGLQELQALQTPATNVAEQKTPAPKVTSLGKTGTNPNAGIVALNSGAPWANFNNTSTDTYDLNGSLLNRLLGTQPTTYSYFSPYYQPYQFQS